MSMVFDVSELTALQNKIEDYVERNGKGVVGGIIADGIRARSAAGVDADNATLAAYVPAYAAKRRKLGLRISPPDLRVTGALLDRAHYDPSQSAVVVAADDEAKAEGLMKKRKFFRASDEDVERGASAIAEGINELH